MKKILNTITNRLALLLILFSLTMCKKFLEIEPNPNQITTRNVFSNDKTALSAISGLYAEMLSSMMLTSAGSSVYAGLYADEIYNTSSNQTDDAFYKNSLLSSDNTIHLNFYSFSYKLIYQANSMLEGLQSSITLSDTVRQQLLGEAKVCRAFMYLYLCNLFGDVPLITKTGYEENASVPRTPVLKIYEQIEKDLKEAQEVLKTAYPSLLRSRPNKWTATALLARVYLYQKKWTAAEGQSSSVIAQTQYELASDLNKVFLAGNAETIWELSNDQGNTTEGGVFIPFLSFITPSYNLSNALLSNFETGDNRKTAWVKMSQLNGTDYYYPYKYKLETPSPRLESTNMLRLAEQYLIRAEARAEQNNIAGAQADINIIRNRAGLDNTTATDKTSVLTAIEQERRIEMFTEWGHRWIDLKRTGRINAILAPLKGADWQATDTLWPIPYAEMQLNSSLTQNPGY